MSLNNLLRQRLGTEAQQITETRKVYEVSEWAKNHILKIKHPLDFQMPTFEQVKVKFWEIYCKEVSKTCEKPIIDTRTAFILKNVCLYLVDDKRSSYNQNKGLMFFGGVGTGKTAIMKSAQKTAAFFNLPKKFAISSVPMIFKNLQSDKDFEIEDYFNNNRCFDDVGFSEPTLLIYGQLSRPIDSILSVRYDRFINEGQLTHLTTNLDLDIDVLKANFDERIIDRLKEMCNFISIQGESFRGR